MVSNLKQIRGFISLQCIEEQLVVHRSQSIKSLKVSIQQIIMSLVHIRSIEHMGMVLVLERIITKLVHSSKDQPLVGSRILTIQPIEEHIFGSFEWLR